MLDLSCTNPTTLGFSYDEELYAQLFDPRAMAYEPQALGLEVGRSAIATHYYARRGVLVEHERVCLTASMSESYALLLALLCDPGDIVLVPSPSSPLLDYVAEIARVELVRYPTRFTGHWSIDTDALASLLGEHAARVKAVVCVTPNSPTGACMTKRELERIDGLCAEADIALIVDEMYSDYPLYPGPHRVASAVGARESLTFVLSGLSKVAALPQFKLAWAVACGPEAMVRPALARLAVIAETYLNLATPVQLALPRILEASEAMQGDIRKRLLSNLDTLDAALADSPISRLPVEAGWSVPLSLPRRGELDDEGWVLRMLERIDTWAQPCSLYDMPGCHLVLSLLTRPGDFGEGLARLVACVEQECRD